MKVTNMNKNPPTTGAGITYLCNTLDLLTTKNPINNNTAANARVVVESTPMFKIPSIVSNNINNDLHTF